LITDIQSIIEKLLEFSKNDLQSSINAGKHIVDSVWGGVEEWKSSSSKKNITFKSLLDNKDFPFGKATAIRKMHLHAMDEKFGGLENRWPKLHLSHFEQVIYWGDAQEYWLDEASAQSFTVVEMREKRNALMSNRKEHDTDLRRAESLAERMGDIIVRQSMNHESRMQLIKLARELSAMAEYIGKTCGGIEPTNFPFAITPGGVQ
jgi:hypothetical protein